MNKYQRSNSWQQITFRMLRWFILIAGLLAVVPRSYVVSSSFANPPLQTNVVFSEDFSSDPYSSGRWRIYRGTGDSSNEATWDPANQVAYLTRAVNGKTAAMFANYELHSTRWEAQFQYRAGGWTSCICGDCGADGLVFMFYKEEGDYRPPGGGSQGFDGAGYGIEFDNYLNARWCDPGTDPSYRHVALIKDSSSTHLAYANDDRVEDDQWHNVRVRFYDGEVTVWVDGAEVLNHVIQNPNYSYHGVGFSASTGAANNNHVIDDFVLFELGVADPYADYVIDYRIYGDGNTHTDPGTVVGPPDCGLRDLSLGGGWIIVDMGVGEEIADGDGADLKVYETDAGCSGGEASPYEVFVSNSPTGPWRPIGRGNGVAEFDLSPSGLISARYVRIVDRSSDQPDHSSPTPGADIDAIEALHLRVGPEVTAEGYLRVGISICFLSYYLEQCDGTEGPLVDGEGLESHVDQYVRVTGYMDTAPPGCDYIRATQVEPIVPSPCPQCSTDPYEPNNNCGEAYEIEPDITYEAYVCANGDEDWFRLDGLRGFGRVEVWLTNLPADYDLYLYRSSCEEPIASSTNPGTTDEHISYTRPDAGFPTSIYIRVVGWGGAFHPGIPYYLRAVLHEPAAGPRVSRSLTLSDNVIDPGESVTARVTVRNAGSVPFEPLAMGVGGRGPDGVEDIQDFTMVRKTIPPGGSYTYESERPFWDVGRYEFKVYYRDSNRVWHEMPADPGVSPRAELRVREASAFVKDFELVQAVRDPLLFVADKPLAVRVNVDPGGPAEREVLVELSLRKLGDWDYPIRFEEPFRAKRKYTDGDKLRGLDRANFFFPVGLPEGLYEFTAQVEGSSRSVTKMADMVQQDQLRVIYYTVRVYSPLPYDPSHTEIVRAMDKVRSMFPAAWEDIQFIPQGGWTEWAWQPIVKNLPPRQIKRLWDKLNRNLSNYNQEHPDEPAAAAVAFVSNEVNIWSPTGTVRGIANDWGGTAIVTQPEGFPHELGHVFGFGEEYGDVEAGFVCNVNPPADNVSSRYHGTRRPGGDYEWYQKEPPAPCQESIDMGIKGDGCGVFVDDGAFDVVNRLPAHLVPGKGTVTDCGHLPRPQEHTKKWRRSLMGAVTRQQAWVTQREYYRLLLCLAQGSQCLRSHRQTLAASTDHEYLHISGVIHPDGSVELDPWYRHPGNVQAPVTSGDSYVIEFRDAQGAVLSAFGFDPAPVLPAPADGMSDLFFSFNLPFPSETARILIVHEDEIVADRIVSVSSPSVTLLAPNGGEHWTSVETISWTASDPDGDTLFYVVQYSSDGIVWNSMAVDITETRLQVEADLLPGSNTAIVRIIATDGVNTGSDSSDAPFSVARKPPIVTISSPISDQSVLCNASVLLSGTVTDLEDGTLPSDALQWYSDRDGLLGTGSSLTMSDLSQGVHLITLQATDQDGNRGQASVRLTVLSDSDDDGVPDDWERAHGLDPNADDGRQDRDADYLINRHEYFFGTDPSNSDTDSDTYPDGIEVSLSANPLDSNSRPELDLPQIGWNLLSLPLSSGDSSPGAVLSPLDGSYDLVYTYTACADPVRRWQSYDPSYPQDPSGISEITPGMGLWVRLTRPDAIEPHGTLPSRVNIPLCTGWNLIGYPSVQTRPIEEVLSTIAGLFDLVYFYDASADPLYRWQTYDPDAASGMNTLTHLEPGKAYWIKVTRNTVLVVEN